MAGHNRISVVVDDEAKEALVAFQKRMGSRTRDEALEDLLHAYARMDPGVQKELETQIKASKQR